MLIGEISTLPTRGLNLLAKVLEQVPLFRVAQFKLDPSTFLNFKESLNKTGSSARAEHEAAKRHNQTPSAALSNLAIYTCEYAIDELRLADANVGQSPAALKNMAERKMNQFVMAMFKEIQNDMIAGDGTSNKMVGLSSFVKDASAAGQTSRFAFTTDELAGMNHEVDLELTSANHDKFLELLEKKINEVPGANAIIVNESLAARLTTIARNNHIYGQINDAFNQTLETILTKPIIKVPETAISNTESDGDTGTDRTSLYVVRFAEELGTAFSTNNGFAFKDFEDVESKPTGVSRASFHLQLSPETTDSMRRLSKIKL